MQINGQGLEEIALFNTFLGLANYSRNDEQEKIQNEILSKLDYIIKRLDERNVSEPKEHI